jgi:NAD(P)-dependent dehydrogenase (short-subunit alcohol dehydrogenase family)
MGTNHLGHFALTGLLMPLLKRTEGSRIVVVSSTAHALGNIDLSDLNWEKRNYNTQRAYGDSKLANLYFTYELARRLQDNGKNPRVTAAHPGWTATDLQRHLGPMRFLNLFFAQSVDMGALPTLRAAFDEQAESGDYFGPEGLFRMRGYPVAHDSNGLSHDADIAKELWQVSEEMTVVSY